MQPISKGDAAAAGALQYFTGMPCRNGHVDARHVKTGACLGCNREKQRRLKARRPDDYIQQRRGWYRSNKEQHLKLVQRWRATHPDQAREINRRSHAAAAQRAHDAAHADGSNEPGGVSS